MERILIAEDEKDIQEILEYNLRNEGFECFSVSRGDEVVPAIESSGASLVLLDHMLPGMSGAEVCKAMRENPKTAQIPLIMVTAKDTENDKIVGLENGADDYITKPFSPKEVVARVKALFRRTNSISPKGGSISTIGELRMDIAAHRVFVKDEEIFLTHTEFKLLRELINHKGTVISRENLMGHILGSDVNVTARVIDVHLVALRKKLGLISEAIETVRGVGYRFKV